MTATVISIFGYDAVIFGPEHTLSKPKDKELS